MKITAAVGILAALLPSFAAEPLPVPRFTDPGRKAKLQAAFPEIEKIFERYQQQRGIPGLVFGVVVDGELVLVKGFGVRDRKTNEKVTPDTLFRIASMTKSFTTLAILKLRDEGKLSLEDPVSKWIPQFARMPYPTADTAPLRIRNLLTHGAGFPEDNPWGDRQLAISDELLDQWLAKGLPFSTAPDTAYEYSNYGFALLGRIVTKASGIPYRTYLEKNILAPIGMKSSGLEPSALPANLRATGYKPVNHELLEEPSLGHGGFGAMGGLVTSANDLARYVAYQLSAFPPRDEPERGPVRRSSQREMQHPWRPSIFNATRPSPDAPLRAVTAAYGYGLSISQDCRFNKIVGHGGGLPGFGSYMMWLPDYGVGMFAMANLTYAGPVQPMTEAFDALKKTGALLPRELPPSPTLLSTRTAIVGLWNKWDDANAAKIAADNLFLDTPAKMRGAEIERLKSQVGQCAQVGDVHPENLLRGRFRLGCERGSVEVVFTLAPTMPPSVQALRFTPALQMDDKTTAVADALASARSEENVKALGSAPLIHQLEALHSSYGSCRVGETLAGDGKMDVRVRWECDRGPVEVSMRFDEQHQLLDATFVKPTDVSCVP